MTFSSISFIVFFVIVLYLLYVLPKNNIKKWVLFASSLFFYGYWSVFFLFVFLLITIVNYFAGKRIFYHLDSPRAKVWLYGIITLDLAILGMFKYYNFFVDSLNQLFVWKQGLLPIGHLEILLPIGISFVTFEVISYNVDIYRKHSAPAKTILDFSLLIFFFPHLVAGPILKPNHFLPQVERKGISIKWANIEEGAQIFIFGLVKKLLVADRLAEFADPVFNNPSQYDSLTVWLAVVAYAVQIYCDFSGYTDMAIGAAKCMGFEIPKNFNMPYISLSITEFWRRWHISLSTWLREYLYISLGGNRKGKVRQNLNLMIVMLLGGLWHGASWNFVVWGGLQGIGLVAHKMYFEKILKKKEITHPVYRFFAWLLTLVFVCTAWVFFRSVSFSNSWIILGKMYGFGEYKGIHWLPVSLMVLLPIVIAAHLYGKQKEGYFQAPLHTFRGLFILFVILLALVFFSLTNSSPFIYFQF
ncbi:MBOAT family protein [Paenibacillus sp. SI8]|uniref:MBOAT family O-acyltransferase n=1 Tax=unclassified Paenibacillus TaxID=185978 RepID=UPI0034662C68